MSSERATLWQIIGPIYDRDYHHDVRVHAENLHSLGTGVTIERWIFQWACHSDFIANTDVPADHAFVPHKIVVYAEDGRLEGDAPALTDQTLAWQFNELVMLHSIPLGLGLDQAFTRYEAAGDGYLLNSQGQREQRSDTGLSFWIEWGALHDAGLSNEVNLDLKFVWQLRYLLAFPPGVTPP